MTRPAGPAPPVERVAASPSTLRSPGLAAVRTSIATLTVVAVALVAHLAWVSDVQHHSSQVRALARFRERLALGTAPVAEVVEGRRALAPGTPVALLRIPSTGLEEVVLQGTSAGVLMSGPGHRRGTPLPGQAGTSVVLGRRASYGGPFAGLAQLRRGTRITVTSGLGEATFRVTGTRRGGDLAPTPLGAGEGRLELVTAGGSPYSPSGVVRVDAELTSDPFPPSTLDDRPLAAHERPLGTDATTLWAMVLWLQALLLLAVGATWSWLRWGRHQTWIVFLPPAMLVALAAAGQFVRLLPNLL